MNNFMDYEYLKALEISVMINTMWINILFQYWYDRLSMVIVTIYEYLLFVIFKNKKKDKMKAMRLDKLNKKEVFSMNWVDSIITYLLWFDDGIRNKIINDIFGGIDKMITCLMDESDDNKLNKISQIIKNTNLEHEISNKSKSFKLKVDRTKKMNYFNTISNESISHILGFLNHDEIKTFKLLSSRIGIIALQEMMKYELYIFNMNELIINHKFINMNSDGFNHNECTA